MTGESKNGKAATAAYLHMIDLHDMVSFRTDIVLYAVAFIFPLAIFIQYLTDKEDTDTEPQNSSSSSQEKKKSDTSSTNSKTTTTSVMQPARTDLPPPKGDPFTQEQLKDFDGSDSSKPVYVAIKGARA